MGSVVSNFVVVFDSFVLVVICFNIGDRFDSVGCRFMFISISLIMSRISVLGEWWFVVLCVVGEGEVCGCWDMVEQVCG